MPKILAIDDIKDNLLLLREMIRIFMPNCTLLLASSGQQGVDIAIDHIPDTILLDLNMPGLDGFDVIKILKNNPITRPIPIIIVTAQMSNAGTRIKALEQGADAFLTKPIDEGELVAVIKAMLRIRKAEELLRTKNKNLEALVEKRAKEMQDKEVRYASIFDVAGSIIIVFDLNNNIVEWNHSAEKTFGIAKEEIIGKNFLNVLTDTQFKSLVMKHINNILKGKDINEFVSFITDKNDEKQYFTWNMTRMLDTDQKPIGLVAAGNEITRRMEAETQFEVQFKINSGLTELARALLKSSLSLRKISRLVFEKIKTITKSSIGYAASIDPKTNDLVLHYYSSAKKNNTSQKIIRIAKKSNYYPELGGSNMDLKTPWYKNFSVFKPSNITLPFFSGDISNILSIPAKINEKLIGHIVVANSSRNFTDTDIENINKLTDLFAIAIQRKYSEQELLKAKNLAEQSDELKSSFLANMSHEIRTPMNAIMGFSSLLENPDLSYKRRVQFVNHIVEATDTLLQLVDDIIDISKIESGQLEINLDKHNPCDIINDVFSIFTLDKKTSKPIEIKRYIPNNSFDIITDKARLCQILCNLVGNAIKFTEQGSIEFGFEYSEKEVTFFVKDTGIGIDKSEHKIIFERFRKIENKSIRLYGGTGLGLSISKSLVEMLGGKIYVESEINKGATFKFSLPLLNFNDEPNLTPEEMVSAYNWENKTILVAEDEEINFIFLEEALIETGATILHAENGTKTLDFVKSTKIDLILMDVKMPEMDGYEATTIIKRDWPNLPIIAQTAYALVGQREKILAAGFDDYISKPIKQKTLLAIISKYLNS